jgi:hypothetical protein
MFVDRTNGVITGCYNSPQYAGQEAVADNDAGLAAYLQAVANPPVQQVTPLQMRRALRQLNLLATVNTYVATQTQDVQDSWEYAIAFPRNDPMITAAAKALNVDINALFTLAATFP